MQKHQKWKTKIFANSDYNKFTSNRLDAKITQRKLKNMIKKKTATKEKIKTAAKAELKAN